VNVNGPPAAASSSNSFCASVGLFTGNFRDAS
jgi:hypothetical protein